MKMGSRVSFRPAVIAKGKRTGFLILKPVYLRKNAFRSGYSIRKRLAFTET